ncbi:MAG: alpha-hydroxy acid oxidase [Caldimonas sp.]
MTRPSAILSLNDLEGAARRHLPRPIFGYVVNGAEDERSLRANREAFDDYRLVPRVLIDISHGSQATTVLGTRWASPFGIAPLGMAALSAYRGDVVLARAAAAAGVPMVISGSSLIRLETIAEANPAAWFQAYLPGDLAQIDALIARVAAAGFATLVITADTPTTPNRENNLRAGFSAPLKPSLGLAWQGLTHPSWLLGTFLRTLLGHGMPHFENNYATRGQPIVSRTVQRDFADRGHLDWSHFAHIRRTWRGSLVLKGLLHPDDAVRARDTGADALIVSNHGGRQLDGAVPALHMLARIVAACPEIPVMVDGGFRRGTDVLKALALGARLAFVGRPFIYAAAIGGVPMLAHAIDLLRSEVGRDMALLGVNAIDEISAARHLIRAAGVAAGQTTWPQAPGLAYFEIDSL